ncbi:hypothetical protein DFH09DRAFT_1314808 [Mycena vulgaris]|nr:hypothetical protein DFH09DRAFT_1314808 [Mycena vulgaris]
MNRCSWYRDNRDTPSSTGTLARSPCRARSPARLSPTPRATPSSRQRLPTRAPGRSAGLVPHARAASTGKRGGERNAAHAIFPVHAVVLPAHCAKLPRLPPCPARAPPGPWAPGSGPLAHPPLLSSHAFAILRAFMYIHRLAPFLSSSSSRSPSHGEELAHQSLLATLSSPLALHALASHLCAASSNLSAFLSHAGHVKELWQDMVALGVYDPEL